VSNALDGNDLEETAARRVRVSGDMPIDDIERAVQDVLLQLRSRASLGPAISKTSTVPPGFARAMQASDNVWREIEAEFGLLTSSEVATRLGYKTPNRYVASDLRRKGYLLGVRRLNAYRYPGFQFRPDGTIHPVIRDLVTSSRAIGWSDSSLIIWLCSASRAFAGGGRPVDHLDDQTLVTAAIDMLAVDW